MVQNVAVRLSVRRHATAGKLSVNPVVNGYLFLITEGGMRGMGSAFHHLYPRYSGTLPPPPPAPTAPMAIRLWETFTVTLDILLNATYTICSQFHLLGTYFHFIICVGFVENSTRTSSSCSHSARAFMSSASRRLTTVLPPMQIFPSCSSETSDVSL